MSMYGSIHTHFESQYDTGNDKEQMVKNFIAGGAKKVAVTEHGVFSSYEDLKDIVAHIKEDAEKAKKEDPSVIVPDFDIIPGVEGYFGEDAAHMILIAKDYEGYLSLCKIISESNKNIVKGKPIITLENLQKNVSKGHLICTSACIAGPFGRLFGLDEINLSKKINAAEEELRESGYREYKRITTEYEEKKAKAKQLMPTKTALNKAQKNNADEYEMLLQNQTAAQEIQEWMAQNESAYKEATTKIKALGSAKWARKVTNLENHKKEMEAIKERIATGQVEMDALLLLNDFTDIFGEKDFYFELQNHGLEEEAKIYNNVISFAYRADHTNFIASNDIHVGVRKDDASYEDNLKRRNVIKFTRFNTYQEESADDREYTIKNNEELREELLKVIHGIEGPLGHVTAEEIVDSAIENIENTLKECAVEFPKNENHYPKFCDDENAEFERLVREGIKIKFPNGFPKGKEKEYEDRLEYELGIIKSMGYAGYHLIVADYLTYGRLLGYLPTAEEIENAPTSIEELDAYITEKGYPRIGYNIGPGRGSAVGSLCCYVMGITDIDPMPYGLLFERFLNTERVSMPDIDSDFRTDIRAKVVDYCRAKYGSECICQIMTKSFGATKGNLRLAARYLGSIECSTNPNYKALEKELTDINAELADNDFKKQKQDSIEERTALQKELKVAKKEGLNTSEINARLKEVNELITKAEFSLASLQEEMKAKKASLKKEMDAYMKTWYNRADNLAKKYDELGENLPDTAYLTKEEAEIVELAETLDGVFTGYGQHAAGTIISGDDLTGIIPLMWNEKKGSMETQCTMAQAEAKGLLKMDFLGLDNLNIITEVIRHPTKKTDMDERLQNYEERDKILKDSAIYKDIFCTGLTQGVFQFESPGMKKMLVEFQPECFEDIILLVAAYRPGPMDYIPEIIASKWHEKDPQKYPKPKKSITLENKALEAILSPTYGCPIYQEQIMQIFQQMAGYSLGGADIVRRYMSKKKVEKLAKEKHAFIYGDEERGIPGCMKLHGISEKEADDLFEQMMPFAKYGFNKSHATAYAMVALFTAYLKKYHTADFFRSSLNAVKKLDEIPDFAAEMPAFGLEFKAPSMFNSENAFSVEEDGKVIRYGLKYIKGFSEQNVHRCSSMQEFIEMNPGVSLKILEKYAQLGMFEECWTKDKRHSRVKGNRHECLRWLKENGELLTKYLERSEKTDDLLIAKTNLEYRLSTFSDSADSVEKTALEKELNKVSNQHKQWEAKRKETAKELNDHVVADYSKPVAKENPFEILENRKWEIEYLSMPFDIEGSFKAISSCNNTRTFNDLKISKEENGSNLVRIPAVVLSVSEEKKSKSGASVYYDVSLMDRNRNITTRRFAEKPNFLEGEFSLTVDECKYFTCNLKWFKPISTGNGREKQFKAMGKTPQEKIKAIQTGGQLKQVQLPGRKAEMVISQAKDTDLEERE